MEVICRDYLFVSVFFKFNRWFFFVLYCKPLSPATNDSTGSVAGAGGEPPSAAASPDAAALVVLQPPAPPYPPYAHYDGM